MPGVFAPLMAVAGTLLAAFHAWLLGKQAWTGQLDYDTSLRWLLAFGLVCALLALRRYGVSLRGRRATALWVLAAMLHGPALADAVQPGAPVPAEASGVAIQIAGAAVGLALVIAFARIARSRRVMDSRAPLAGPSRLANVPQLVVTSAFLPRPPPIV
jgi:hypothetical protein